MVNGSFVQTVLKIRHYLSVAKFAVDCAEGWGGPGETCYFSFTCLHSLSFSL